MRGPWPGTDASRMGQAASGSRTWAAADSQQGHGASALDCEELSSATYSHEPGRQTGPESCWSPTQGHRRPLAWWSFVTAVIGEGHPPQTLSPGSERRARLSLQPLPHGRASSFSRGSDWNVGGTAELCKGRAYLALCLSKALEMSVLVKKKKKKAKC